MKIPNGVKKIVAACMFVIQLETMGLFSNILNMKAIKSYNAICQSFSDFLNDEGVEDPQLIYEYYNYALWNGYFSKEHELQYNEDRDMYWLNYGMSIMSGQGVCLEYGNMLSKIFRACGHNAYGVVCYVHSDCEIDIIKLETLCALTQEERKNLKQTLLKKKIFDKEANRDVLKEGQEGNVLEIYEDKPFENDAWDVELYHFEKMQKLHIHFSKIEYTAGGEKRHLTFRDTVWGPEFEPLMDVVYENNLSPVFICESAGTQTEDARTMKLYYETKKCK